MDNILRDLTPDALARAIEANQRAYLADLGRSSSITLHRDPQLWWFASGLPFARLNRVLRAQFEPGDMATRIETTLRAFGNVPLTWHTGPTTRPADLGQHLLAHGLVLRRKEPGMAIELARLDVQHPLPPGLEIRRVEELDTLEACCRISSLAFDGSAQAGEISFKVAASMGPSQQRWDYAGLLDGRAVVTATLLFAAGVAGLYNVAVLPEMQGRGIGKAMTLTALAEARAAGYHVSTLHASALGEKLYRRLGFQEYCRLGRYIWEPAQEA